MPDQPIIRIALADDHTLLRKSLAGILNRSDGLTVVAEASDGLELRKLIEGLSEPPTVCILDVNMPHGGYEALTDLKQRFPSLRFIILTMLDHEMLVLKMFRAGASGYIMKDQDPEELVRAIWAVAAGGCYFPGETGHRMMSKLQMDRSRQSEITLSPQEERFLRLTPSDMPYKEIAQIMGVSERTVDGYREALFEKLKVKTRTGLALAALQMGYGEL